MTSIDEEKRVGSSSPTLATNVATSDGEMPLTEFKSREGVVPVDWEDNDPEVSVCVGWLVTRRCPLACILLASTPSRALTPPIC